MASKSEAFYRERSRSPVTKAKADEPQDLEIVLEPLLPDSQEPPAVFDPLIERIIFNAVADNHMAALRGLPQIDIEALRQELESIGNLGHPSTFVLCLFFYIFVGQPFLPAIHLYTVSHPCFAWAP